MHPRETSSIDPLDNPVWSALGTRQAHLRQGDAQALRYLPDVAPFAALADMREASFASLGRLIAPQGHALLLARSPLPPTTAVRAEHLFDILQMVDRGEPGSGPSRPVVRLGAADSSDMLDLATKTQPGPFGPRTHEMGHYVGVREQGRLVAMAGERMQWDGHVEISAVCVDPAWRGKGLAGGLMNLLRREIRARGDVPLLHVKNDNLSAIALYERLGFATRRAFHLYRITQPA